MYRWKYFAKHQKIEGYYESQMPGRLFGCDRLMKQDNMFGTLQLGYNPNRERVFLFANMKCSSTDHTVASRYQKEIKEYQQKSLSRDNENRAYVSRRWEMSTVLIEKRENKPWTKRSIASYLGRANLEAVRKNLPFFIKDEEQKELDENVKDRSRSRKKYGSSVRHRPWRRRNQHRNDQPGRTGKRPERIAGTAGRSSAGTFRDQSAGIHSDQKGSFVQNISFGGSIMLMIFRKRISRATIGRRERHWRRQPQLQIQKKIIRRIIHNEQIGRAISYRTGIL
ncbi:MAG: hypothetical protein V8S36_06170 [Lachnospiraceae bacterium]